MGTSELGNRVVPEFREDAAVQLGRPGASDIRQLRWLSPFIELVEKQPSQRFLAARVPGEHRTFYGFRKVVQSEDRLVDVGEVLAQDFALRRAERLGGQLGLAHQRDRIKAPRALRDLPWLHLRAERCRTSGGEAVDDL